MITFVSGNMFDSSAQVITNTVNCVGVMGKGLALEFKARFPDMFEDYKIRCAQQLVQPGQPYLWENDRVQILNFPTKRHWREPSRLEDIQEGLKYLATHYEEMGIYTIALPALGCANGGLKWEDVRELMIKYLADISDLEIFVYPSLKDGVEANTKFEKTIIPKKLSKTVAALPVVNEVFF